MSVTPELKHFFAEEVRAAGALPNDAQSQRVLDAFARVPREDHAGDGPWLLRSPLYGLASRRTPDSDPAHLYHNVLVTLDEERGINIGDPSLWARFLARTDVAAGSSVLQVGAGSGYYSAILAELVGERGDVLATETDERLATMAMADLAGRHNVTVRHGNGATDVGADDGPFDLIVAFAGVTHPVPRWRDRLKPGGRMLLPITGDSWWGAMVLFQVVGDAFEATTLGPCGFFPCEGARDAEAAGRIDKLWADRARLSDTRMIMRLDGERVVYEIDGQTF